jgi:hypothetical protein
MELEPDASAATSAIRRNAGIAILLVMVDARSGQARANVTIGPVFVLAGFAASGTE